MPISLNQQIEELETERRKRIEIWSRWQEKESVKQYRMQRLEAAIETLRLMNKHRDAIRELIRQRQTDEGHDPALPV